jgi:4-amino-4-deoxy-L-arabinose transferase-like glycosyltransferase
MNPPPPAPPSRFHAAVPVLIFLLGVLTGLPSIWSESSVSGSDEYTLGFRTPMEMLARGEWLTPWLNGEPRLRKPPLLYWAILTNYHLFGIHFVCARIWGVLAGAGLGVCACLFARRLFRSDGFLAGLLALGALGVNTEIRRAMLDLPLAVFVALAVLGFVVWLRSGRLVPLVLAALSLGLSFLTKGPVGFFFFATGAGTAAWVFRPERVPARRAWHGLICLGLVGAICLPWPLLMQRLWGDRFLGIISEEITDRNFGQWHGASPFAALAGALGLALPWTPLVLGAVIDHARHPSAGRRRETTWLIAWLFASVLPFFFMKTFERYLLAIVPIQAVLAAEWLGSGESRLRRAACRLTAILMAVLAGVFCGFFLWFWIAPVWAVAGLALAAALVGSAWTDPPRPERIALGTILLFTLALGALYPKLGINAMPPDLAASIGARPARTFGINQPSMLSMRLRYSVPGFSLERLRREAGARPDWAEVVFVEQTQQTAFDAMVSAERLRAEEVGRFRTFYSRKAWIRFARADARWPDWREALRTRSLESLKTEIRYYRVSTAPAT